jgi:two-component sensor histidine kinase
LAFNESAQEYYVTERFEPWNWTIVAAVSNDWLLGHLTLLRREALVVALVVWFVTGASVLFIVKHFVLVPLVRMERETEQITGVSDSALPVDEADEFTRLERVIHEVGKTVGFQRRALEDVNSQLEQRVFQQTSELTKKNAALKEEVSQRNLIEQELLKLLDEKETLVREVHHRVKNNLALLYSLIQLQSSTRSSPELERELSLIQARIETMALIHGQLYRSDDLESVEAADYLNKLIDYLEKALSTTRANVRISRDLSPASLDHATARTCGLIVNELVTNSIIHGFPDDRRGEVRVALYRLEDGSIRLCVADNGVGIPDDLVQGTEGSLGMTLVHSLSQQLRGTASVTSENGTTVVVEFPGGSAA